MKLPKVFTYYLLFLITTFIALYLIKEFDISYPLTITNTTKSSELAVVGEGKVEAVPDLATVNAGIVVINAASVEVAQKAINETNSKIIDSLKNLGIKKEDIQTSNYSINPNYAYENGKNRLDGYNGNASVTVTVRKIDQVTNVIDELTKAGANQIYGSSFSIEKPEKYRELARNKAIENAKEQAQNLADNLGIKLGKVVNIVEASPGTPYPITMKVAAEGRGGGGGTEIEPGSQTITSTVTLYFEKR
ncbi:DUF541 domain-containing protein [Candidatus Parcubacteria bacterium]|nr:MAG: DUF541 domain-containing protein [Candidatus Parcubacteria bacterium]